MTAQKRHSSSENQNHPLPDDDSLKHHGRCKQPRRERRPEQGRQRRGEEEEDDDDDEEDEDEGEEEDPEGEDSDGSRSSDDPTKLSEWVFVQLQTLRTCVQCPICLGIIKKTRTVMECLHRFCRACIDKSMRLGNNECPACRKHCASRRSLRDDPEFDALIGILYDDIEKYEEEELAFHEEEKTRNNQIQASIAQILRRQSEALVTRAKKGKDTASACTARLQRNNATAYSRRRRRNNRGIEPEGSDGNEDVSNHDEDKDSSSTDERGTEIKQRRYKRRGGAQPSQPSPSAANSDGGAIENDVEASRESRGTASGPVWNPEMLAWGGGGARSKSVRNTRIMKLTKYLETLKENDDKLDVYLMLIPLDKQRMPSLQRLYYCFPPRSSVECLKEYVAHETQLRTEDIEIILVKKRSSTDGLQSILEPSTSIDNNVVQILEGPETLAELGANCSSNRKHLILAYRLKLEGDRQGSSL